MYKDGVIESEVKKFPITVCLEYFAWVCNLPFIEQDFYKIDLDGNEFNFDTHAHSLLISPSSGIPSPFNVDFVHPDCRMIHYIMNHVLFLRKSNFCTTQKSNVPAVWFLENKIEKIWVDSIIHHMLDSKNKNTTLFYVKLIIKILAYNRFFISPSP